MNILDLKVGEKGLAESGKIYEVTGFVTERVPALGVTEVCEAKCNEGLKHKFIRGIEVTKL